MTITIIAAMTPTRVIADSGTNGMLWHNREELKHFRQQTLGKTCIVGRKTAEQMPVLDGRDVLVISSKINYKHSKYNLLLLSESVLRDSNEEFMVIGGAEIYKLFMPYADKIIISVVDIDAKGDILFPELDDTWIQESVDSSNADSGFLVHTYVKILFDS